MIPVVYGEFVEDSAKITNCAHHHHGKKKDILDVVSLAMYLSHHHHLHVSLSRLFAEKGDLVAFL